MLHLDPSQIPPIVHRVYNATKYKVNITAKPVVAFDSGIWYEGSRHVAKVYNLITNLVTEPIDPHVAPWDRKTNHVVDPKHELVIEHSIFLGHDMGVTLHCSQSIADHYGWKKPVFDLTDSERKVLGIIRAYIPRARADEYRRAGFGEDSLRYVLDNLKNMGYLDKRGALTLKGKNAAADVKV